MPAEAEGESLRTRLTPTSEMNSPPVAFWNRFQNPSNGAATATPK